MPRLDASGGGIDWNNPITRRRFLKRTGAATAATMLALHGMKVEVLANSGCDGGFLYFENAPQITSPTVFSGGEAGTFVGLTWRLTNTMTIPHDGKVTVELQKKNPNNNSWVTVDGPKLTRDDDIAASTSNKIVDFSGADFLFPAAPCVCRVKVVWTPDHSDPAIAYSHNIDVTDE